MSEFKNRTFEETAGIVLGTRVPIVLTSRADTARTRLTSAAVMKVVAESRRTGISTRLEVAHA